jgi:hypothetical protein
MLQRVLLLTTVLFTVGCGGSMRWSKPGMTQEQWKRDYFECDRDVTLMVKDTPAIFRYNTLLQQCLEGRGYTRVE